MDTLLVIGNGFDLKVGADTRYSNFFSSEFYKETRKEVEDWIEFCKKEEDFRAGIEYAHLHEYVFSCWDLLFCIKSKSINNDSVNWCDIEAVIHKSLTTTSEDKFSWKNVYNVLHLYYQATKKANFFFSQYNIEVRTVAYYLIAHQWEDKCNNVRDFFESLLDELLMFESTFGKYIFMETESHDYKNDASLVARKIARQDVFHVDSFNYSDFSSEKITIRHINGTCDNPIFGIDLTPDEEERFPNIRCFTKTARRLRQDAFNLSAGFDEGISSISSAVVFGHSLNKMDYDYFNYLFTMLNFNSFDINKMGSLEFVYHIYDEKKADEIRSNHAFLVYQLLNYYERYVNNSSHHILINILRNSGKLKITDMRQL